MSLLLDEWPAPPEPPEPPPPTVRRPAWPWLVGVIVGIAIWLAVLRADEFAAYAHVGIALALGLVGTALLARTRTPGWLLAIALLPGLILCSSAATYLGVVLQIDDAMGIPPLNGFVIAFGGIWAMNAVVVCSVLTAARALMRLMAARQRGRGRAQPSSRFRTSR